MNDLAAPLEEWEEERDVVTCTPLFSLDRPLEPGEARVSTDGEEVTIRYLPRARNFIEVEAGRRDHVQVSTRSQVDADEVKHLVKAAIDAIPGDLTAVSLEQIAAAIERIHDDLHGNGSLKIDAVQRLPFHAPTGNPPLNILTVTCPTCHQQTRTVLPDASSVRTTTQAPFISVLFKRGKTACGHAFIAFLDKSFKAKGYETIDM